MMAAFCCCNQPAGEVVVVQATPATVPGLEVEEKQAAEQGRIEAKSVLAALNEDLGPDLLTREFRISFSKTPEMGAGIDISVHDGRTLLVGRVKHGGILMWNETQGRNPFERVRRGDRVISVNKATGSSDKLLEALRTDGPDFTLTIRRTVQFRVSFDKCDPLGVERVEENVAQLIVKGVSEGCFRMGNLSRKCDLEIKQGDHIVQVNGQTGNAQQLWSLLQSCENGSPLDLLIRRPDS